MHFDAGENLFRKSTADEPFLDLELGCGDWFISTLVPPCSASIGREGKHCNPKDILKPDQAPQESSRAQMFDITGNGAEHYDLDDKDAYNNNHMDYVPDSWLNALLDEQEANDATEVVVGEAASSGSQAPTYLIQGELTEDQCTRIARNRQISLDIQVAIGSNSKRPALLHRTSFDDAEGGEFQEEPDLRHESIEVESQPTQVKRRRLFAKTNPINTGYPLTALLTRAVYKVQMEQKGKVIRQNGHDKRVAANEAIALLARHHLSQQEPEEVNVVRRSETLQKPHPSHDIASLEGNDGIIWCRRCSSWSTKTQSLRVLLSFVP